MGLPRDLVLIYGAGFLRSLGVGLLGVILAVYLSRVGTRTTGIGLVIGAGLTAISCAMALTTARKNVEIVWLFLLCGVVATLKPTERSVLPWPLVNFVTGVHGVAALAIVVTLFLFFLKAGAFVFGSGLAIVPFLYGGVVHRFHWLNEQQFVDALAVAMITPGLVVITAGFIGYLVAGLVGSVGGGSRGSCSTLFLCVAGSSVLSSVRFDPQD